MRTLDSHSGDLDSEDLWKFGLVIVRCLALHVQLQDSTKHQEFKKNLNIILSVSISSLQDKEEDTILQVRAGGMEMS